ncbi:hypothetical protein [Geminisphaera colitermitum]|uniref:hypothetical protein n=1 Tax=Geminisphaera colitermitum TaxID=1148786 RepID=UPI001E3D91A6|nr:hypothetical protein [Geminisphaera colitermitum]
MPFAHPSTILARVTSATPAFRCLATDSSVRFSSSLNINGFFGRPRSIHPLYHFVTPLASLI